MSKASGPRIAILGLLHAMPLAVARSMDGARQLLSGRSGPIWGKCHCNLGTEAASL